MTLDDITCMILCAVKKEQFFSPSAKYVLSDVSPSMKSTEVAKGSMFVFVGCIATRHG